MAREINLLRRTRLRKYGCCLAVLEAFAERAPTWQRGCLFFYAGLGTWLGRRFGVVYRGRCPRLPYGALAGHRSSRFGDGLCGPCQHLG
jgi:hypothetical protein